MVVVVEVCCWLLACVREIVIWLMVSQSVEAARECGMRAVVVAGRKPLYEMGAADLVVRGLDELSFINLKQLFSDEESVEANVCHSLSLPQI
jgi:hypothetical protein